VTVFLSACELYTANISTPTLTPREVVPSHWRPNGPITLAGDIAVNGIRTVAVQRPYEPSISGWFVRRSL
jgi:hypothetical protein